MRSFMCCFQSFHVYTPETESSLVPNAFSCRVQAPAWKCGRTESNRPRTTESAVCVLCDKIYTPINLESNRFLVVCVAQFTAEWFHLCLNIIAPYFRMNSFFDSDVSVVVLICARTWHEMHRCTAESVTNTIQYTFASLPKVESLPVLRSRTDIKFICLHKIHLSTRIPRVMFVFCLLYTWMFMCDNG